MLNLFVDSGVGEPTTVTIEGEEEELILNILATRLAYLNFEVSLEDADSTLIPYEDFTYGT